MDISNFREVSLLNDRISALEQGVDKSAPILFIHGFLDNANSFAEVLLLLPEYHCIAIDLPGHGKSAHRSEDAHYHLTDYAYDVYALICHQKWSNVTLVGHSLGGIISTILAACFPEKCRSVISIESFGPLTEPDNTTAIQLRESMISRQMAGKAIKQPESMASIVAARLRVSDMSAAHAELILSRNTEYKSGKLYWRTDKRLRTKSPIRLTSNQAMDLIENIQCPYRVILGSRGFTKVKRLFRHRQQWFKKLHYIQVDGGHHAHMESPREVAQFIKTCVDDS